MTTKLPDSDIPDLEIGEMSLGDLPADLAEEAVLDQAFYDMEHGTGDGEISVENTIASSEKVDSSAVSSISSIPVTIELGNEDPTADYTAEIGQIKAFVGTALHEEYLRALAAYENSPDQPKPDLKEFLGRME